MNLEEQLHQRSGSKCELCAAEEKLRIYEVGPEGSNPEANILICQICSEQIAGTKKINTNHWRCLNTSMWSTVPAVQVMAWRLLDLLRNEGWPQDLLDLLYLDDETLAWAKSGRLGNPQEAEQKVVHKDSNGNVLQAGDTVVLIKDLDVKGGGFTAKRGTAVKGISLVENNIAQIEGKVNGQQIVILTQYVKKSG